MLSCWLQTRTSSMYWGCLHLHYKVIIMVIDRKRVAFLPQVKELGYLGVFFMSEGRMEREIDRRISAAYAAMQSVSQTIMVMVKVKFSIYWSIYTPTLTYGHERTRSWKQAGQMSFLGRPRTAGETMSLC